MLEFPIIDSHVHLWDPQRFPMRWLEELDEINRPFSIADYAAHTAGIPVTALVYVEVNVEPAYALLEAQWAVNVARSTPRLQGIVAAAPLEDGEHVRAYLEALVALGPQIKGVRRNLQAESDAAFCLRPPFVHGVQLLSQFGLSFDVCIVHHQLPAVIELVRQCPETSFILDHIAKPDITHRVWEPWGQQITELAALPNVVCKISGLVTEADHHAWSAADLAPYVAHVLDRFGEDRVLFGGDWPVALLASSYERWVTTLDALTTQLPPAARRKLWAANARRVYRLD